jgi:hypothetical protein
MYLNVIPPPIAPLPSVRGLGQFRLVPPPGLGQAASSCAAYLQQQFNALPSAAEAAMLLNTPSPSGEVLSALYINGATSPQDAAQVVYQLAQEFCGQQGFTTVFGGTPPADCTDNGQAAAAAAYPQWLAYYQSLPASVWTTGTVSAQVANNPLSVLNLTGSSNAVQAAAKNLGVQLVNASRPGQSFQVGDTFQLTITGPPNTPILELSSSQNGTQRGGYAAGTTDSTGTLVISGTFDSPDIGTWQETWGYVTGTAPAAAGGGQTTQSASISFSVVAAPASGGSSQGGSQGGGGAQTGGGGTSGGTTQTGATAASTGFQIPSFLTQNLGPLPVWTWGLGALALLFVIPRGR